MYKNLLFGRVLELKVSLTKTERSVTMNRENHHQMIVPQPQLEETYYSYF